MVWLGNDACFNRIVVQVAQFLDDHLLPVQLYRMAAVLPELKMGVLRAVRCRSVLLLAEEFARHHQHAEALAIPLLPVTVVGEVGAGQPLQIGVADLSANVPTVVNDDLMYRHIGDAIDQDADAYIKAPVAPRHDAEHHEQPARNGEDQGEEIVALKGAAGGLVVVAVQRPADAVHHILVRGPGHELHGPEGGHGDQCVE